MEDADDDSISSYNRSRRYKEIKSHCCAENTNGVCFPLATGGVFRVP